MLALNQIEMNYDLPHTQKKEIHHEGGNKKKLQGHINLFTKRNK